MKKCFAAFIIIFALSSSVASAGNLFVETGPGIMMSRYSVAALARYQRDTSRLFNRESYYEAVFAYWNGDNHANAIGIARGIKLAPQDDRYYSVTFGGCHINRETGNLGTPFQFYIRLAYNIKSDHYDLSLGYIHISNGKLFFGWNGPNNGENFITLSIGLL